MSAKYTKIPIDDPEDGAAFNYKSVFTYEKPSYFSYGEPSKNKYQSAFTYLGISHNSPHDVTIEPVPKATLPCVIWAAVVTVVFYIIVFATFPISYWFCFKKLPQHERMIIFRLGRMLAPKGPGLVIKLPLLDRSRTVDLRTKAFRIPPIMIRTDDACTIEVGAEVWYHVKDAVLSVTNVQDLDHTLRNKARTCMLEWMGKFVLKDILSPPNKRTLQIDIVRFINDSALPWGIEVTQLEMSPIKVLSEGPEQQNPMEVLQTLISGLGGGGGGGFGGAAKELIAQMQQGRALPGASGVQGGGPQMAQLMSAMQFGFPPNQTPVLPVNSIQPHLQGGTATLVEIDDDPGLTCDLQFSSASDLLTAIQPHLSAQLVARFGAVYKFVVQGQDGGVFYLDLKNVVARFGAVYKFVVQGQDGGVCYLDLKNGTGSAAAGEPPMTPDVTMTLDSDDLEKLLQGQMNTVSAYMSGRLQLEGDTSLATKLTELIEVIKQAPA